MGFATTGFARRTVLRLAASAAVLPVTARLAAAQTYPARTVRLIVDLPAGLAPDVVARLIAPAVSKRLGQPVVVENRPGAAGNIGTEYVVRAAPDGYTLLMAISGNAINATLYPNLTFNFEHDIAPTAFVGFTPFVLVATPSLPAKSLADFIAYAKANPDKVNMASPGTGTAPHLAGELFKMLTGIKMVHVPYRSNYMPDLLGGQVQVAFIALAPVVGLIHSGKLRALGVTSAKRIDVLPDVPAIDESVPEYEGSGWLGIGAPKGTPGAVVDRLNSDINAVIAVPEVKASLVKLGVEPEAMSPAQFGKLIADATDKWAKVIKFADIKPD